MRNFVRVHGINTCFVMSSSPAVSSSGISRICNERRERGVRESNQLVSPGVRTHVVARCQFRLTSSTRSESSNFFLFLSCLWSSMEPTLHNGERCPPVSTSRWGTSTTTRMSTQIAATFLLSPWKLTSAARRPKTVFACFQKYFHSHLEPSSWSLPSNTIKNEKHSVGLVSGAIEMPFRHPWGGDC